MAERSPVSQPTPQDVKNVIGIYGIPGSGKSYLLSLLKQSLQDNRFVFYEGSQLIASVVPGGLEAFQVLDEQEKTRGRERAIKQVVGRHNADSETVVIVGHYMFWKEGEETGTSVLTQDDLNIYTHILYFDVLPETIVKRREQDLSRARPTESVAHLTEWQHIERTDLRRLCYQHGILFSIVRDGPEILSQVLPLLQDFPRLTEASNLSITRAELGSVFHTAKYQWKTLFVIDADKTLASSDTGELFWAEASKRWPSRIREDPLTEVFKSYMQYTYKAFVQAMLLYQEMGDDQEFDDICKVVASTVTIYPEFVSLLQVVAEQNSVGAVVVTCGLRQVWEEVLLRHGLSDTVKVIGGGRLINGFVVTGEVKQDLVSFAKTTYRPYVCAFGDSPLDLGMLKEADQAIVVVGDEKTRSKSMEDALLRATEIDHLDACQVVIPSTALPRLSAGKIPVVRLTEQKTVEGILRLTTQSSGLDIRHATSRNASKLLTTPTRDARNAGPHLREDHRIAGRYLATEYLSELLGLEEYSIPHVGGYKTTGYRVLHQDKTLIVPLMRAGEPMALGVSDVLPDARFVHASSPEAIRLEHLHGVLNVILVDWVVNSGDSVLSFVQYLRRMHSTIRIVVMAGVVQRDAVSRLEKQACCNWNFKLIALRISNNKYTGKGGTDTGNRLFNTTHLDT